MQIARMSPSGLGGGRNGGGQGDMYGKWVERAELEREDSKFMILEGQVEHRARWLVF